MMVHMHIGIAHHFGWAVAVTATADFRVVDRRRIELIDFDLPAAPIHHQGGPHSMHRDDEPLGDDALIELVTKVRASVFRHASDELNRIANSLTEPVESLSVRNWPSNFPTDMAVLRNVPYESRADSVMYCQVLADVATQRKWCVHRFEAKTVETQAAHLLGMRAYDVIHGERARSGSPWSKDHRIALAAAILASQGGD